MSADHARASGWQPFELSPPLDHNPRCDADPTLEDGATRDEIDHLLLVLEADVAARLAHVCAHFAPEEFDRLVNDVARVRLKYGLSAADMRRLGLLSVERVGSARR